MDVAEWLHGLGLGQYEAAFHENAVSADLLPRLTADDLREIGVAAVGHRRRLLDAIADMRAGQGSALASSAGPQGEMAAENDAQRWTEQAAERRQVSVMFCDMVGFTTLSSRLDPEELDAVAREYQARVAAVIARFGGFIAHYVGDGVVVYFGWPEARETDAERAVDAALAVAASVGHAPIHNEWMQVRLGIATGVVVVGDPIGSGASQRQAAIGEAPNLAARLQSVAPSGSVVIDTVTRQLIGGLFDCRDLGLMSLKGLPEPERAWEVVGRSAVDSRFAAFHQDRPRAARRAGGGA